MHQKLMSSDYICTFVQDFFLFLCFAFFVLVSFLFLFFFFFFCCFIVMYFLPLLLLFVVVVVVLGFFFVFFLLLLCLPSHDDQVGQTARCYLDQNWLRDLHFYTLTFVVPAPQLSQDTIIEKARTESIDT